MIRWNKDMRKTIQTAIQIVFLVIFIGLIFAGKIQLWMALFLAGVLSSFLLGRVYCGWICPINTVMSNVTRIKKKLKLKDRPIPAWIRTPWTRYAAMALFIGLAVFANVSQRPIPVLPALLIIGILLTLFYPELLWHRYLCPYGTNLHFPAKASRNKMQINPSACNSCGVCARVCPTATIDQVDGQFRINKSECLVCFACQDSCRKDAILYHSPSQLPLSLP